MPLRVWIRKPKSMGSSAPPPSPAWFLRKSVKRAWTILEAISELTSSRKLVTSGFCAKP